MTAAWALVEVGARMLAFAGLCLLVFNAAGFVVRVVDSAAARWRKYKGRCRWSEHQGDYPGLGMCA
jgi:hypothetical protein